MRELAKEREPLRLELLPKGTDEVHRIEWPLGLALPELRSTIEIRKEGQRLAYRVIGPPVYACVSDDDRGAIEWVRIAVAPLTEKKPPLKLSLSQKQQRVKQRVP